MGHRPGEFERGVNRGGLAANCVSSFCSAVVLFGEGVAQAPLGRSVARLACARLRESRARALRRGCAGRCRKTSAVQGCASPVQGFRASHFGNLNKEHPFVPGWGRSTPTRLEGRRIVLVRGLRWAAPVSWPCPVWFHQYLGRAPLGCTRILAALRWGYQYRGPRQVTLVFWSRPVGLH